MAIYRIYPSKDSTLYTKTPNLNTGRDAMLELGSNKLGEALRSVIAFDQSEVESTLTDIVATTNYTASLTLYVANAENLGEDSSVDIHPLAESWTEGVGHYLDAPYNAVGVSWKHRDGVALWDTSTYSNLHNGGENVGGGTWINTAGGNTISSSIAHTYRGKVDLVGHVTAFTKATVAGDIVNNGLLLKLNIDEFSTGSLSYMQLFSLDTNTVYYPHLEMQWDDSSYVTSLDPIVETSPVDIKIKDVKKTYADTGKVRFRIHARSKYPTKTFQTTNIYLTNNRLPAATYWGIKDEATGEMVIDFSTFATKVSADGTSNYFDVYMDNLFVERYYKLVVKTTLDGATQIIESEIPFKLETNG